jgi:hypothetical protein
MRLKGQDGRRLAEGLGALLRRNNDRLMPAVDAVEIAHGHHGAVQRRIGRVVAHDQKASSRHWLRLGKKKNLRGP